MGSNRNDDKDLVSIFCPVLGLSRYVSDALPSDLVLLIALGERKSESCHVRRLPTDTPKCARTCSLKSVKALW